MLTPIGTRIQSYPIVAKGHDSQLGGESFSSSTFARRVVWRHLRIIAQWRYAKLYRAMSSFRSLIAT